MASSISVAVRVRPLTEKEKNLLIPSQSSSAGIFSDGCLTSTPNNQSVFSALQIATVILLVSRLVVRPSSISSHKSLRNIVKVLDERVLVFDPAESNPIQQAQRQILAKFSSSSKSPASNLNHNTKKVKDMRFCFDRVFDETATQQDVYHGSAKDLIDGVLNGFNATVFAYGATGCGKTHTITGTTEQPGIVYLLMKDLFGQIADQADDITSEISISYLEIYNETIRDLLNPNAPILNLREANSSVSVPGLSTLTPETASDVITLISTGNSHRTVHGTEANAVSSRSHAVLSVNVRRKPRTAGMIDDWTVATLSVIDLAGSERASVTKNKGDRLLEGANINKSLLALGNCINALCDPKGRGAHVPYRNSKLTRLLKHSLGGNCRTLMIVCVAPTSAHYDETHNTLQYANRAKEIKTKATRNIISVDRHVSQYVQVIFQLRQELEERKKNEALKEDRMKKELTRQRVELDTAIGKARKHWDDYLLKARPASYASGRLEGLQFVRTKLCTWNEQMQSDPDSSPELKSWLAEELHPSLTMITGESQAARHTIEQGEVAKSMYEACVGSLGRTVERSSGPEGKLSFDKEIAGWVAGVGKIILESIQDAGRAKTLANLVGELAVWLTGLTAQFFLKPTSEQSQRRFTEATKAAFQSFSSTTSNSNEFPSGLSSLGSNLPKLNHSPTSSANTSNATRSRRSPSASSPTKAASAYFAKRTSPSKRPIFAGRMSTSNHGGILKRSVSVPMKSEHPQASTESRPKSLRTGNQSSAENNPKSAGVRWRDVESDGEERLESFDRTGSSNGITSMDDSMLSSTMDQSSILLDLPSHPSTSSSENKILSNSMIFQPPSNKPSRQDGAEKAPVMEMMNNKPSAESSSASAGRSNRMRAGYLSRSNRLSNSGTNTSRSMMVSTLDSLGEEEEGDETLTPVGDDAQGSKSTNHRITLPSSFTFNRMSSNNLPEPSSTRPQPMLSNRPSLNNLNSSRVTSSTFLSSTSAALPQKDSSRRESLIGPIRKPKPFRRQSLNVYSRQASSNLGRLESDHSHTDQAGLTNRRFSTNLSSLMGSTSQSDFPRRASRVPVINNNTSTSSSSTSMASRSTRSPSKVGIKKQTHGIRRSIAIQHQHHDPILSSLTLSHQPPPQLATAGPVLRPRRVSLLPTPVHNPNLSLTHHPSHSNELLLDSFSNNNNNNLNHKKLSSFSAHSVWR